METEWKVLVFKLKLLSIGWILFSFMSVTHNSKLYPFHDIEGGICSCTSASLPAENVIPDDQDVLEEENIVKQQSADGLLDSNVAVQLRGLVKTYPGSRRTICCFCKNSSAYHALKVRIPLGLVVNENDFASQNDFSIMDADVSIMFCYLVLFTSQVISQKFILYHVITMYLLHSLCKMLAWHDT